MPQVMDHFYKKKGKKEEEEEDQKHAQYLWFGRDACEAVASFFCIKFK